MKRFMAIFPFMGKVTFELSYLYFYRKKLRVCAALFLEYDHALLLRFRKTDDLFIPHRLVDFRETRHSNYFSVSWTEEEIIARRKAAPLHCFSDFIQ